MRYELFVARRVAAKGEQSFSRLILRIATIAVAMSMTVMICTTALVAGFQNEISSKIFGFWGHIHITDANIYQSLLEAKPIPKDQDFYPHLDTIGRVEYLEVREVMGRPVERWTQTNGGIRHIQTFALRPGIIKAGDQIEGIVLKGVGPDFDWKFMEQFMVEGDRISAPDSAASDDILISRQTADRLQVGVGDRFTITFVTENSQQLQRRFDVSGIYKTGLEEYDRKFALVDLGKLQQLMGWDENQVGGFEIFVDDIEDLEPITEYIYLEELPNNLFAESIRKKLPEIFEWLALQDVNEIVIISLMVVVAIINMITALLILILERTNMIGTLKSLGASNWSIRQIFLYYAARIIAVGIIWGNVIGIALCLAQKYGKFIKLQEENYYLSYAPIDLNPWLILLLNVATLVITVLFLVVPSYLVTRIDPIKAIRFK